MSETTYQYVPDDKRLKIPCLVKDGSEVVFHLMGNGLVNIQTTNGHYVAIDNRDLKALVLFLMTHVFPDENAIQGT